MSVLKKWLVVLICSLFIGLHGGNVLAEEGVGVELSYQEKKDIITEIGLKYEIPPEILKAIAYVETGMRQFDENGNPIMNANDDGGIGIMQVTLHEDDLKHREINREWLKWDTAYNIEVAAQLLDEKWNWTGTILPQVNDGERDVLENWYFAVLAYNGLEARNDPNRNETTYQERVYQTLSTRTLLPEMDFPSFQVKYEDGGNIMKFVDDHVETDTQTKSTQMFTEGDHVYSYALEPGSTINFREQPTVSSRKLGDVPLYMPLTVNGKLEHDNHRDNLFGYYPFHYADAHGFMASSYVREGKITEFYDIRDQEVTEAVGFLEARGIISGYSDGSFRPYEPIYRRHVAAILQRALDLEVPSDYELQAMDMREGDLGYDEMKAMEYHGIMKGSNGNIRPNEYMTRAQMATILTVVFDDQLATPTVKHTFEDVPMDFWSYEAINRLYDNGLTTVNTFRPNENVTRSQFALFLKRVMDEM